MIVLIIIFLELEHRVQALLYSFHGNILAYPFIPGEARLRVTKGYVCFKKSILAIVIVSDLLAATYAKHVLNLFETPSIFLAGAQSQILAVL